MKVKRFKPGDRVRKRGEKQIMIVLKYCLKQHFFLGSYLSSYEVECVWYENSKRRKATFDERTLTKVLGSKGIFEVNKQSEGQCIQENS